MITYDKSLGSRLFDALNICFMCLVILVTLYPVYFVAIVSLSHADAVLRGEVHILPVGFTLAAYKAVFKYGTIVLGLRNSVVYTAVGTLINLVMTTLCAYPLSRPRFTGRLAFTWMVTLTMFFSGGLIPLYLLILQLGLRDSIWALVLPVAISPWNMFILRTAFQQLPEELFDATRIDGANDVQMMLYIALPLVKPVLATLLLYYAVAQWNEWFNALIFLDNRAKYPAQLILRNVVVLGVMDQSSDLNRLTSEGTLITKTVQYATIMVSTVPILLVYPFVQKYFVKGVMIGAIKG
jgi:putative aldouronate transport system permease protein